jgi:hypothetical protein
VSTIPDDHHQHRDTAPGTGTRPAGPEAVTLTSLRDRYGSDWEILVHLDSSIVSAEHRSADGRAVRYLVAHSVAELAGKLETAGTVEP